MVQLDHMINILALTFTVFSYCYSSEVNITFHNNETTWIGAVKYCASIGAVLFSDEQYLRNQTTYEVWTGKYKALTPWRIIWGCYVIDFKNTFPIYGDQPECQKKCTSTDFYALKDTRCVCLQQTDLRNEKRISPCNCSKCVQVLKRDTDVSKVSLLTVYDLALPVKVLKFKDKIIATAECDLNFLTANGADYGFVNVREGTATCPLEDNQCCMAAACLDNKLKLTSERCSKSYKIICDDHANGGHDIYEKGRTYCFNKNSILRRYTRENLCPNETAPHWTSGLSTVYGYTLQYKDNISNINPVQCFRVAHTNTNGKEYVKCNEVFPFYCQAGSIVYEDTSLATVDGQSNDSNNKTGAIGGSISAILIIVIVAVTGIYLYRRRVKEPQMRQIRSEDHPINVNAHSNENNSDGQYHEINVKTFNYSLAKPMSNNKGITTIEDDKDVYTRIVSSALEIQNEASKTNNTISNQGYNDMNLKDRSYQDNTRTNPEDDKMHVSDYALAKPITDNEELDPYTTNTDYDHLNSVKKPEMSDMKVYDHLKNVTESDPTYDHAGVTVGEDTENYAHFNIEK